MADAILTQPQFQDADKAREHMDAFAKHIHGNEAFSLESVAKAVEEALAKKEHQS